MSVAIAVLTTRTAVLLFATCILPDLEAMVVLTSPVNFFTLNSTLILDCMENDSLPSTMGFAVLFGKNGNERNPLCIVTRNASCSTAIPFGLQCGCVSDFDGVRIFQYKRANISFKDAGNYSCVILASDAKQTVRSQMLTMPVYQIPQITPTSYTELSVRHGENVMLVCETVGIPTPSLSWFPQKQTKLDQLNETTLRGSLHFIANHSYGITQSITCTASNLAGTSSIVFMLTVQMDAENFMNIIFVLVLLMMGEVATVVFAVVVYVCKVKRKACHPVCRFCSQDFIQLLLAAIVLILTITLVIMSFTTEYSMEANNKLYFTSITVMIIGAIVVVGSIVMVSVKHFSEVAVFQIKYSKTLAAIGWSANAKGLTEQFFSMSRENSLTKSGHRKRRKKKGKGQSEKQEFVAEKWNGHVGPQFQSRLLDGLSSRGYFEDSIPDERFSYQQCRAGTPEHRQLGRQSLCGQEGAYQQSDYGLPHSPNPLQIKQYDNHDRYGNTPQPEYNLPYHMTNSPMSKIRDRQWKEGPPDKIHRSQQGQNSYPVENATARQRSEYPHDSCFEEGTMQPLPDIFSNSAGGQQRKSRNRHKKKRRNQNCSVLESPSYPKEAKSPLEDHSNRSFQKKVSPDPKHHADWQRAGSQFDTYCDASRQEQQSYFYEDSVDRQPEHIMAESSSRLPSLEHHSKQQLEYGFVREPLHGPHLVASETEDHYRQQPDSILDAAVDPADHLWPRLRKSAPKCITPIDSSSLTRLHRNRTSSF